jgi:hypothetical protein
LEGGEGVAEEVVVDDTVKVTGLEEVLDDAVFEGVVGEDDEVSTGG